MTTTSQTYLADVKAVLSLLRADEIAKAIGALDDVRASGGSVFLCGNGGSASTASHLAVDLARRSWQRGATNMRVMALTDNVPWLTAVSNDRSYDECFAEQLRSLGRANDLLIGISASGDSENVVRAFQEAQGRSVKKLALVGFDGGRLANMADIVIRVDSYDYGIVESVHLLVGHMLVDGLAAKLDATIHRPCDVVEADRVLSYVARSVLKNGGRTPRGVENDPATIEDVPAVSGRHNGG